MTRAKSHRFERLLRHGFVGAAALVIGVLAYRGFSTDQVDAPPVTSQTVAPAPVASAPAQDTVTPDAAPSPLVRSVVEASNDGSHGSATAAGLPPEILAALGSIEDSRSLGADTKALAKSILQQRWSDLNAAPK